MALMCFFVGYSIRDKSKTFIKTACYVYIIFALFLGLYSILKITHGFIIADAYLFALKNSSGAILGTGTCITICMIANTSKRLEQNLLCVAGVLMVGCIMTFRCRTAMIAIAVVLIAIIVNKGTLKSLYSHPKYIVLSIISAVILISYDLIPFDFIFEAFTANKDVRDANDLTSGRLDMIAQGLRYFHQNALLGASGCGVVLRSIDCMPIAVLCKNGLIGAFMIYPVYIALWWIAIYGCVKASPKKILPYALILFLCITSLSEETYPFGPGTPVVGSFVFLGIAMGNQSNSLFNFNRDVKKH